MTVTRIIKEPDDKLCTRISIGGSEKIGGFYVTYRGDLEEVKRILANIPFIMEQVTVEAYVPKEVEHDYETPEQS
jgi:hypothetical protein